MILLTNLYLALIFNHEGGRRMRKDIREKSKRGRRIRKTYKWELKSSPMGGDFFFISEKDIEKNHDISIQKISEE